MPTRNRPALLRELLTSLSHLSAPEGIDVEVLVGDNSTDDRSAEVCEDFPAVDYHRNPPGLGAYDNFNALLARARGDWVHLVADDDDVDPGCLRGLGDVLADPDPVIITGDVAFTGTFAEGMSAGHQERLERMGISPPMTVRGADLLNASLIHGCPFVFSMVLIRRQAVLDMGGFATDYHLQGDFELWMRLLGTGSAHFATTRIGTVRAWEDNELHRDSAASREFRIERTLLRLTALDLHDDLLTDDVRRVLVDEVRREMPRVRAFARSGFAPTAADALLSDLQARVAGRLAARGIDTPLESPLARLVRRPPRRALQLGLRLADGMRDRLIRVQPDGGDVGERGPTPLGWVGPREGGHPPPDGPARG